MGAAQPCELSDSGTTGVLGRWWPGRCEAEAARDPLADLRTLLCEIAERERVLSGLSDAGIRERAEGLRRQVGAGEELDALISEGFALVKVAAHRALGERPFDVQLAAAIGLCRGRIVEMQTGEGKTLAAVAPVVLNAFAGRGVHVLTHNDYLARRDAEWMGPVYDRLGVSVAAIGQDSSTADRYRAYREDVTYLTVKEAGFDLLRDGLSHDVGRQVHRRLNLALVDEADSILIDEARVPLVIAGSVDPPPGDLREIAAIIGELVRGRHFDTDEVARNVFLTDRGVRRAEELLGCGNLFSGESIHLQALLRNALHAEVLLHRDVDYIVRNGTVELVDELTGRVAENRHWPDGLQAAIEAKEGLHLRAEGRVLGSITIQHFLKLYPRLAGMTATARAAARELSEVYGLDVTEVPSHRPCVREDLPDVIYLDRGSKRAALVAEITRVHASGRPVLVGTASVAESEELAADLERAGATCRVLNARNDTDEAAIIAEAGALGAVTISTNMAGRGTDIRLGGSREVDREQVQSLGGLYVIGTNRHESRRVDDQLRGRAGRQGDPGTSRFFISLQDRLMKRYGLADLLPARLAASLERAEGVGEGSESVPLEHPAVHREIARVQRIVEGENADIRQRLLGFARLVEQQRRDLYHWRQGVLEGTAKLGLLAERSPVRWQDLRDAYGPDLVHRIEQRLTLLAIDASWREHLAEMQAVRDEIHLVTLDGRDPLTEFYRVAGAAFEALFDDIDDLVVDAFGRLEVTAHGINWAGLDLRGPSSTWTYLIDDNVFAANPFRTLAHRPAIALWAVLLWWPVLLAWGIMERLRRSRTVRRD